MDPEDLLRAGIQKAKCVIKLANSSEQREDLVDATALLGQTSVNQFDVFSITELVNPENIRFFSSQGQSTDRSPYLHYYYASGQVYWARALEDTLLCQVCFSLLKTPTNPEKCFYSFSSLIIINN